MMKKTNYWWFYNVELPLKNFKQGVINLYKWFPVIWKDRNWDYSSITTIQLFKLKQMYEALNRKHTDLDWDKSVKALRICINILERKQDDWYFDTFRYLIRSHSIDEMFEPTEDPNFYQMKESWTISDNMELYNKKEEEASKVEKRDWELYHHLISKYNEFWWN